MWLFLLRSAMEIASSSLPSRSAPATCCTKTRDCFRAALYINARSIITPNDQADRMNRTVLAMRLMELHIDRKSQFPACSATKFIADTATFATIRFAPFHSFGQYRPKPSLGRAPAGIRAAALGPATLPTQK